jgi:hypothetical protein
MLVEGQQLIGRATTHSKEASFDGRFPQTVVRELGATTLPRTSLQRDLQSRDSVCTFCPSHTGTARSDLHLSTLIGLPHSARALATSCQNPGASA